MTKNNIRKSPEGARKYVGSDIREARAEQVNLIKVGRFWWFLRNSWQHATAASHWIENCSFSDITAGCATIIGHVRISPLLIFSRIFVPCFEIEFQIRFSPVFFHHMTKSTSDRWSSPLNKKATLNNVRSIPSLSLTSYENINFLGAIKATLLNRADSLWYCEHRLKQKHIKD